MLSPRVIVMFVISVVLCLNSPGTARAAESYDNCTGFITSIPATISTQGTWCFNQDLATAITSGAAVTIATNNVTIDCNNFKLGGLSAGPGTSAFGIYADLRLNATVRNCNIRGFYRGISFAGSSGGGHAIEDNRFDGNTFMGIYINGDESVVQRNRIFDTGGTLGSNAYGIYAINSINVIDNTISGVIASVDSDAYGIYTSGNSSGSVNQNKIGEVAATGLGIAYGIFNNSSGFITATNNNIIGNGSAGSVGLRCTAVSVSSQGTAKDNIVKNFVVPIESCTNSGGNVVYTTPP